MQSLNQQMVFWIEKCQKNLNYFRNNYATMSIDAKNNFIEHQHHIIHILRNVIDGNTQLRGVNIDRFNKQ